MILCEYGCTQKAKYQFKNGKWCCSENVSCCPNIKKKISRKRKGKIRENSSFYKKKHTIETKEKISKSVKMALKMSFKFNSDKFKKNRSKSNKGKNNPMFGKKHPNRLTIRKTNKRYPFFSRIEEMRYNPDKPDEKEIQVHCKNHNCPNSKEKGGWFTPSRIQLAERIRQLEDINGNGGSYFYCSEKCKNECPLFRLQFDPLKEINKSYNQQEYQTFRQYVLQRDNYKCQYCSRKATEVHHERPEKLEPFLL